LRIPYDKLVLGKHTIFSAPHVKHVFEELTKMYGDSIKHQMILFLLHEKFVQKEKSFWKPFLDILPDTFSVPVYFSQSELELLKGSSAYEDAMYDKESMKREYQGIRQRVFEKFPAYFPPNAITLEDYIYMTWIWNSRIFFIEGRQPREHLVPLADMINCEETEAENAVFVEMDSTNKFAILKADKTFKKGQQITESYGKKSNSELLRYEGFIIDDERYMVNDCIYVSFPNPDPQKTQQLFNYMGNPKYCLSAKRLEKNMWPGSDYTSLLYLTYVYIKEQGQNVNSREEIQAKFASLPQQYNQNPVWKRLLRMFEDLNRERENNPYAKGEYLNRVQTDNAKLAVRFQIFEQKQIEKITRLLRQKVY
jgi:hypothetical protein